MESKLQKLQIKAVEISLGVFICPLFNERSFNEDMMFWSSHIREGFCEVRG